MRRAWAVHLDDSDEDPPEKDEEELVLERRRKRLKEATVKQRQQAEQRQNTGDVDDAPSPKGEPPRNHDGSNSNQDRKLRRQLLELREKESRGWEELGQKRPRNYDIFSDSPGQGSELAANLIGVGKPQNNDEVADKEGYYQTLPGEILASKYEAITDAGQGVFSSVIKANVRGSKSQVAIKLIRNNQVMFKAGQKEIGILKVLNEADPANKRHCIRMLDSFTHRGHLAIVFESMDMNLRTVLKKYGGGRGISMQGVRLYCKHLLFALHLMQKCNVVHADLKPDNILVSSDKTQVKVCDFGSASFLEAEPDLTPYLVSRFYRAPEIILGLPYGHAVDMWSLGCCLYELYTGQIAFAGRNNNAMLKQFQEVSGPIPPKLLRKSAFRDKHFDTDLRFMHVEVDPVSKAEVVKPLVFSDRPDTRLKEGITRAASTSSVDDAEERKRAGLLADLLGKMFTVEPTRRISVGDALKHPFLMSP